MQPYHWKILFIIKRSWHIIVNTTLLCSTTLCSLRLSPSEFCHHLPYCYYCITHCWSYFHESSWTAISPELSLLAAGDLQIKMLMEFKMDLSQSQCCSDWERQCIIPFGVNNCQTDAYLWILSVSVFVILCVLLLWCHQDW